MPFVTALDVTPEGDDRWRLTADLVYRGAVDTWTIPRGYVTDLASVPRVVSWLIPRYGRWTRAAIVHDYLITHEIPAGRIGGLDTDGVFRRILRELGVSTPRRALMWAGVRWGSLFGGRWRWDEDVWTLPAVLGISVLALPVVLLGGIPVAVASLPLALAELLFPGRPEQQPRHPARRDEILAAITDEVEDRTQALTDEAFVGDVEGWRPTGIITTPGWGGALAPGTFRDAVERGRPAHPDGLARLVLGTPDAPEVERLRRLAAGKAPGPDEVAPSAATQRRARLALELLDQRDREALDADGGG